MKVHRAPPQFEDSSCVLLARVEDLDGNVALAANVSEIVLAVYDLANPSNKVVPDVSLTPIGTYLVPLTLNTTLWKVDTIGYNLKIPTQPTWLPHGDRVYRFDVRITFLGGHVTHAAWDVPTLDLKRS
jgi:hypothetical protein